MRRWLVAGVRMLVVMGAIVSAVGPAAASGKGEGSGSVESRIREVNKLQRYVYLEDGTMLEAPDPRLLDQLVVGSRIRAAYEERGGRKLLTRFDIVP